jgi:hypothetical protein
MLTPGEEGRAGHAEQKETQEVKKKTADAAISLHGRHRQGSFTKSVQRPFQGTFHACLACTWKWAKVYCDHLQ